ncbi:MULTISPECIES: sugar-phosphatase [unclassified Clostridioides]|uniref:sugar-phosphatase n=1 Tax=unclassified Clostridioides TaxID=2635829 RepID=UPI001D0F85D4|nr:sugar-phosphatase [Clostridioides sp. ES-S-0171-01]MCC0688857.1 sugar-phosphatase [Clostridioides sp. ES-S-0056-01]UDN53520.1 sugar-phosphatase [Clostridioides sp. ES-S-0054-01]
MYKLIALDIDGTILDTQKRITPEVFESIQEAKKAGAKVVITTGRPLPGVKELLNQLNLTDEGDYVICFNGAIIQEVKSEKIIHDVEMTLDDFDFIYNNICKKYNTKIHINTMTNLITPNETPGKYTLHEAKLNDIEVKYIQKDKIDESIKICKIMIVDEPERLEEIIQQLPKNLFNKYTIVRSAPFYLEFLGKTTNKGTALKTLCANLNIPIENAIAVGDEENDQHMIKYAGLGVAMGNARNSIKEIADYVTDTNNENGVAKVINKYILNKAI